jgi:glyoxylate utilization-related uncharacterized protein
MIVVRLIFAIMALIMQHRITPSSRSSHVRLGLVVPEAPLEHSDHGTFPVGDGWFVVNARDAQWFESGGLGFYAPFEGENAPFGELGFNLNVLRPGEPSCMYHGEETQEDFLVLAGACVLIVEGHERQLNAWDFVHCPPWTEHVFVGAGDEPVSCSRSARA